MPEARLKHGRAELIPGEKAPSFTLPRDGGEAAVALLAHAKAGIDVTVLAAQL